jgi:hypothetical protein
MPNVIMLTVAKLIVFILSIVHAECHHAKVVRLRAIRLTRNKLPRTNEQSSLFCLFVSDVGKKVFIALTPGPNVIKLFTAVIYECS